jgi:hypothetical protein
MMVCAHGDVSEFCMARGMEICETWSGDIAKYDGVCRVLVTDANVSEYEYYYLKGFCLARGIELISTRYEDDKLLVGYLHYENSRRKEKLRTRQPFGWKVSGGVVVESPEEMAVVRLILKLRDAGLTLREITEDERMVRPNGARLSMSTIQNIIKNRKNYD